MIERCTLKKAREKANLCVNVVSNSLGMSTNQYLKYENHDQDIDLRTAIMFAEIANCNIDSLIFTKEESA